ncbi:hypothetical protein AMECASPLE_026949 [Ameca splendens]|uniref:Uncharacterized protein n=1 Tax=Ameca splendens TaxID=208324 RepID=A0ABV0XTY7_9TELE
MTESVAPLQKKIADQPAQHSKNKQHKAGHTTNMPNHPKIQGAEPTERQVLNAPQPGTGLQPQPGQWSLPGSQADPMMHHPAHHHAQRERRRPSNPKGATKRPKPAPQRGCIPPETEDHQHPSQPSKTDRAKPQLPPSQCHSNSDTIHPSICL